MVSKILLFITFLPIVVPRHIDREQFLEKKRQNKVMKKRQEILDTLVIKDKEYLDGIIHYRSDYKDNPDRKRITDIENDFRRSVAMEGVKYIYKRGFDWGTWRKVKYPNGEQKSINYKCNHQISKNSNNTCETCGLWTIEESPLCPYEFFSMINKDSMCGYDYINTKDYKKECPTIIKFNDLYPSCDNPIETSWRFTTDYSASKEYNVICGEKDYCEISTSYLITPKQVVFRMMNTNNEVIYSRIMKANNTNYVCVSDCGHFDPNRKKVVKSDNPTKLSFFPSPKKNKRDLNDMKRESMVKMNLGKSLLSMSKQKKGGKRMLKLNKYLASQKSNIGRNMTNKIIPKTTLRMQMLTTMSSCKHLRKKLEVENYSYDY